MTMKELEKKIELLEKRIETIEEFNKTTEEVNKKTFEMLVELNDKIDETDHDLTNFIDCVCDINETTKISFEALDKSISNINDMLKDYKLTRAYVHTLVGFLNDIGVHIIIK